MVINQKQEVRSGIPQGSILGLLLFLLYVKNIGDDSKIDALAYVDDVKTKNYITEQEDVD